MKKLLILFSAALILTAACSRNAEEPVLQPLSAGEISGERLWKRVTEDSDYNAYGQWYGHTGLRPGRSPHGAWHKVYVNRVLFEAVPLQPAAAPYGTIIVKENYDSAKKLDKLTLMAKVQGYSPATNDWFWAAVSPDGKVLAEGSPGGCISCHEGMAGNDYIIIKNIDEP